MNSKEVIALTETY